MEINILSQSLIIIGGLLILIFTLIKYLKKDKFIKKNNIVNPPKIETEQNISEEYKTQLSEETYIRLNMFNNDQQNKRINAILGDLDNISFWVTIIGIYFLIKLIWEIVVLIIIINLGYNLNEYINILLT